MCFDMPTVPQTGATFTDRLPVPARQNDRSMLVLSYRDRDKVVHPSKVGLRVKLFVSILFSN
jgi:hypothetical protein